MTHVKISSVPDSWTPAHFITELCQTLNWKSAEKRMMTLVHVEKLKNKRYLVRIGFTDARMLHKLTSQATKTADPKVFSLRVSQLSVIVELMNNINERFKLQKMRTGEEFNIVVVKNCYDYVMPELLDRLYRKCGIGQFEYVSFTQHNCFLRLAKAADVPILERFLREDDRVYARSSTLLKIDKHSDGNAGYSSQTQNWADYYAPNMENWNKPAISTTSKAFEYTDANMTSPLQDPKPADSVASGSRSYMHRTVDNNLSVADLNKQIQELKAQLEIIQSQNVAGINGNTVTAATSAVPASLPQPMISPMAIVPQAPMVDMRSVYPVVPYPHYRPQNGYFLTDEDLARLRRC